MSGHDPNIVAFLCNWCSYAGADLAGVSRFQYPTNLRPVRVMCSTRVSPHIILELFKEGADGVLVAGCHIGDCHYINGNLFTEKRIKMTRKLLELAGVEPERLRLEWISASEGEKFANTAKEFIDQVKSLGESPAKGDHKVKSRLAAAVDSAKNFRLKVLNSKNIKLTEEGNVYGELVESGEFDNVFSRAAEEQYMRSLILQLTEREPLSVIELAEELEEPTDEILEHVVALRSDNLIDLDHVEEFTPKYRAITLGGA